MEGAAQAGEGELLWEPSREQKESSRLAHYMGWLAHERGKHFDDYEALWRWSVDQLEPFWDSIWDYFDVQAEGSRQPVLASQQMPGAQWYPGTRLNYAEHTFRNATADRPALIARS